MAKEFKISSARLKELEAELHHMKTVREKEVAEQIKEARSYGDLSENSEYDEAKNEQAKLYGRIAEVENILANAVIIDELETSSDVVGLGCIVTVCEVVKGQREDEEVFKIVGSQEANPVITDGSGDMPAISDDSPIGRALVGKSKGEVVEVLTPSGAVLKFELLNVERK